MYAIIVSGGRQHKVSEGEIVSVDKINANAGETVEFKVILKADGDKIITEPGTATAEIVAHGKEKKIVVFKYKPKKNVRKKQGHRQQFTKIKILSI